MAIDYPAAWADLKYPWVRSELLGRLAELAEPIETAKWLNPNPTGPIIIGIDQQIHFFFDDHSFGEEAIGFELFDHAEVQAVASVTQPIETILVAWKEARGETQDDYFLSNRFFLIHPLWPTVVHAAAHAFQTLSARGVATIY